jgi:hypothetical protein
LKKSATFGARLNPYCCGDQVGYLSADLQQQEELIDILESKPTNAFSMIGTICEVVFVAKEVTPHAKRILNAPSNQHSIL